MYTSQGTRASNAPYRSIRYIQFGVLSPDEIKEMAVCEIKVRETTIGSQPVEGGLCDARMGADREWKCGTCAGNMTECPGHFGYIQLAKPVYHYGFIKKVMQVLRCICFSCSKLLVPANSKEVHDIIERTKDKPRDRLQAIAKLCANKKSCGGGKKKGGFSGEVDGPTMSIQSEESGCNSLHPGFRLSLEPGHRLDMIAEYKNTGDSEANSSVTENKILVSAQRALEIFKRISPEDCVALGFDYEFSRPEWMIISVLPVPPLHVRPAVEMGLGGKSHDDLTFQYQVILRYNQELRDNEAAGVSERIITEIVDKLQLAIANITDNDIPQMPQSLQKSKRPIKSLKSRLSGKEGRVRGNLMGKRVDFSARTVITPDPNLSIDQVGVPTAIAKNMTVPEIVTSFNQQRLQTLVDNGVDTYPGAKYVVQEDGTVSLTGLYCFLTDSVF